MILLLGSAVLDYGSFICAARELAMHRRREFYYPVLVSMVVVLLQSCTPSSTKEAPSPAEGVEIIDQTPTLQGRTPEKLEVSEPKLQPPTSIPDPAEYLGGAAIPFFNPDQAITISYVSTGDWGIGSIRGESDHILKNVSIDLWTDATPPEPAPAPGQPPKRANAFFLEREKAWVAYTTGPGTGQNYLLIWRMLERFPRIRWAPSLIELNGNVGGVRLYFLNETYGWAMITFDEGGMNKQHIALYASRDGGATWDFLFGPMDGSQIQSCAKTGIVFENAEEGWITRSCEGLFPDVFIDRTVDGGRTWTQVNLPPPSDARDLFSEAFCSLFSPHFFAPRHLIVSVDCVTQFQPLEEHAANLYSTSDAGQTWSMQPSPGAEVYFITRFIAYSVGREIHKTENGGLDWERVRAVNWDGQLSFSSEERAVGVVRNDDEIAYVETSDGGQSFYQGDPTIHRSQEPRNGG